MENLLKYKGYRARTYYSDEDACFVGEVIGINDVIGFDGESVEELHESFHEAVDAYLESCAARGKTPDKEYKGSFNIRIGSDLHAKAVRAAEDLGISLNQFVTDAISAKLNASRTYYSLQPQDAGCVAETAAPLKYRASDEAEKLSILKKAAEIIDSCDITIKPKNG